MGLLLHIGACGVQDLCQRMFLRCDAGWNWNKIGYYTYIPLQAGLSEVLAVEFRLTLAYPVKWAPLQTGLSAVSGVLGTGLTLELFPSLYRRSQCRLGCLKSLQLGQVNSWPACTAGSNPDRAVWSKVHVKSLHSLYNQPWHSPDWAVCS